MDEDKNITPEKELEAIQATKEEEVREKIIEEYGFTEEYDSDTIDKLVEKDLKNREKLSDAIRQKIKQRDRVKELETELGKEKPKEESKTEVKDSDVDIDTKVNAILEKKSLDELEYSDELKEEIDKLAKLRGISIKSALKDPYITFKISEYEKEEKVEEASINRSNKKTGKQVFTFENPPEVDMNTEEGRNTWDEYMSAMKKAGY